MKIGVELDGAYVRLGIVDSGIILKKIVEPFNADKSERETIEFLISMIRKLMNSNIAGVGIGVPSLIEPDKGIVYSPLNIPSWKEVHLKDILEREFNVPVAVNNDCNCFAFGERYFGEGTAFRNLVCITMGTGLGAGIIIDDKLYKGNNSGAGEIGALKYLDSNYERYCSNHFFSNIYNTTFAKTFLQAQHNDSDALRIIGELGTHIGNMLSMILFAYDPEAVILNGELTKAFELYAVNLYKELDKFPFTNSVRRLKIILSRNENIGILGSSALA